MRLTWVQPEDLLTHELAAAAEEGKPVGPIRERWLAAGGAEQAPVSGASDPAADPALRLLAARLLDDLNDLASTSDPAEPDTWEAVEATLPAEATIQADRGDVMTRLTGAWYGRAAGCLLGKPVEKIPREGIAAIARATGRWPVDRYFTEQGLPADLAARWPWNRRSRPTSLEENIDGMPEDDDLNYPMLAVRLLETRGRDFTTADVAQLWLDNLPAGRVFTAERAAYRNLLLGLPVDQVAERRNPFRQWIGALIRADVFGWANPRSPREAARMAWTDARLSHRRNGIYGALWAAGLASAALVCRDVDGVLDRAMAVVPPASRLAQAIVVGREAAGAATFEAGLDRLNDRYGQLHWVHVLNNAATIAFALARGGGDFTVSVGLAVMAGWDTDSVGATVGGVVGALNGVNGIGAAWTDPLKGVLKTSLPGGDQLIDTMVERTAALIDWKGQFHG
jgi:ADP-ribosylglycohydrolase